MCMVEINIVAENRPHLGEDARMIDELDKLVGHRKEVSEHERQMWREPLIEFLSIAAVDHTHEAPHLIAIERAWHDQVTFALELGPLFTAQAVFQTTGMHILRGP